MIEAAVPPVAALLLGPRGSSRRRRRLARVRARARSARRAGLQVRADRAAGLFGTFGVVAANFGLGLLLVALKLVTSH